MLRTRLTDLLGLEHPVVLGGMGSGTSPALIAAVSGAGGLGVLGATRQAPDELAAEVAQIRQSTDRPFGLNLLLFLETEEKLEALLAARPAVMSFAWPRPDQDLAATFALAHDVGAKVMHMVDSVPEAVRAAQAGADIIVAQGGEGGGHVGLMGTLPLVPMVVQAVAPVPVLAAGGVADGRGLAAALALGAEGVLLGTRFLATHEAPLPDGLKQAILRSDGHDTIVSEIPDVASGQVWPGAYARTLRNRFIESWLGREGDLRRQQADVSAQVRAAYAAGDADHATVYVGQTAGLIESIEPAGELVRQISADAETILRERLPRLLG